jgi:RNA polymerase sigma-70 factor (ECF subfamily)
MTSEAISGLIDQRRRFLQFVVRRVQDRAIAEDILQAAYARALDQQTALRSDDYATAWFYRILRNAIIDHYRRQAIEGRVMEPLTPGADRPAEPTEAAAVCHCIHRALDCVKPTYSQILREVDLARAESYPLNSFAKRAGITPGNAAVRAHRARHAIKQQLLQSCGPCAKAGCLDCSCP